MDCDDELDEMIHGTGYAGSMVDQASEGRLDPMDITDPAGAYFLLSDDTQDEITETDKKRMKCRTCGHRFMGEIYDRCPECFSSDIDEGAHETKNRYW
jgi:rubrerythrin